MKITVSNSRVLVRRWLCLGFLVGTTSLPGATETEYMAVLLDGKKVGHAAMTRAEANGQVTSGMAMEFSLLRGQTPITMKMSESMVETAAGEPLSFRTTADMGFMVQRTEGTVRDGQIELKITTGGSTQSKTLPWPSGALMSEGARLEQMKQGFKEGTRYTLKMFEVNVLQALDAEVIVGPTKEVDLLGRVVKLTEVTVLLGMGGGQISTQSYVDGDYNVQKMVMSMMGINFELVACSRDFAMSSQDPVDVFDKVILKSPARIPAVRTVEAVTYHLTPDDPADGLALPETGSQKVNRSQPETLVVTVRMPTNRAEEGFPYQGTNAGALAMLKPTRYIESDRPEIVALARKAVGDEKNLLQAVQRIEAFVADYIVEKDLSVGYATAAEVAESRQGDCTEHSVLATALCRAAGIPARVAHGLAYVDTYDGKEAVFVPHAWSQAYVGGQWLDFDAALNGFTPGHLTLSTGEGEPADFFNMVSSLGTFKITRLEITK